MNLSLLKNSLFLYFRMIFTLSIGLYTSRLVLDVLGIDNYGLYDLVAGIVVVFYFLQHSLTSTSTRFLSLHLSDRIALTKVFSSSFYLHLIFIGIIVLVTETLGLWFLNFKANIPETRLYDANVLYQLSIVTLCLNIIQIPYNSIIISREKINVFAYISILESLLRLTIPIVLYTISEEKRLFMYALFMFLVSLTLRIFYHVYCIRNFDECRINGYDIDKIKEMSHFFGWDLLKTFSDLAFLQSIKINISVFYGIALNAAVAVAQQAQGGLGAFVNNFTIAMRPQIFIKYSSREKHSLEEIIRIGTRINFFLLLIVAVPVLFHLEAIFKLWLTETPPFAETFLKISLITLLISVSYYPIFMLIEASGKIKNISIFVGIINILGIILSYFLMKSGSSEKTPYLIKFVIEVVILVYYNSFVKTTFKLSLLRDYSMIFIVLIVALTVSYILINSMNNSIIVFSLQFFVVMLSVMIFGFTRKEKRKALRFIYNKFTIDKV